MKEIELIQTWLASGRNYQVGVEIYRRLGDNDFLKKVLLEEDEWNTKELTEQLIKLLDKLTSSAQQQLSSSSKTAQRAEIQQLLKDELKPFSERTDAPEQIKEAIKRRKFLYAQARDAHSKIKILNETKTNEAKERRYELSVLILSSFDEIKELWDLTNFFDAYQKLPENTQSANVNFEELDIITLNQDWLIDYKYIRKNLANVRLKERVNERIINCQQREKILRLKDAFVHENLTLPDII